MMMMLMMKVSVLKFLLTDVIRHILPCTENICLNFESWKEQMIHFAKTKSLASISTQLTCSNIEFF